MSDRYVIARIVTDHFGASWVADDVVDLPDADDVHLHRNSDGTWTAVRMVEARTVAWHDPGDLLVHSPGGAVTRTPWVDSPVGEA